MNILFDGNYLVHKCFSVWSTYYTDRTATAEYNQQQIVEALVSIDKQQVLVRKILIDAAAAINRFTDIHQVVFVFDSTSWRYRFYPDYKYALTRQPPLYQRQFIAVIDYVERFLRNRGFIVSRVLGAEGDDLMYIWSIYFSQVLEEDLVIVTGDSDIQQIVNRNVSVFCNNSKNLQLFCIPQHQVQWDTYLPTDIMVHSIIPLRCVVWKAVMGDSSDNIPKLKRRFGKVAFEKFFNQRFSRYDVVRDNVVDMAQWIAGQFADYVHQSYEEVLGKTLFNLQMTWLNLAVYNEQNFLFENQKSLLENMLEDVNRNKDSYKYSDKFDLEHMYKKI